MRIPGALVLISACLLSCGKQQDVVPYVPVKETLQIRDPRYTLNSPGGYALIEGGVAGIIIYHRPDDNYVAYDRCSSYEPEKECAVELDEVEFQVIDPCSGSKFQLSDGSPVKGPASRSLRSYTVIVLNTYEIRVTN